MQSICPHCQQEHYFDISIVGQTVSCFNCKNSFTVQNMKKCPYCAETIRGDAVLCRYCNKEQPVADEVNGVSCTACQNLIEPGILCCPLCGEEQTSAIAPSSVKVSCSGCATEFEVDDESLFGEDVLCPNCNAEIHVPLPESEVAIPVTEDKFAMSDKALKKSKRKKLVFDTMYSLGWVASLFILGFYITLGLAFIWLGINGFTQKGIRFSSKKTLHGKAGKTVGVISVVIGIAWVSLGLATHIFPS